MNTIPAGKYFIGDPCYCFSNENNDWMDYLTPLWDKLDETHIYGDNICFATDTKYGDGVYQDQYGVDYCVDAGLIGATPLEIADKQGIDKKELRRLGQIVTFKTEVSVEKDTDSVIVIGHIRIQTDDELDDWYE